MKIDCINLHSCNKVKNTNFQSNMRKVVFKDKLGGYWTTTYYFRGGFNWSEFINFVNKKYKKTEKVNVIDHACSCGAEAESLVILLKNKLKNNADKFFPIIAKDIDSQNIAMAKNNYPKDLNIMDIDSIELYTDNSMHTFFDIIPLYDEGKETISVCAKPVIRDNIDYSEGDIFKDIDSLPKSNTILLCRNMWIYLTQDEQKLLAEKICNHFDKTSLIVVGEYDLSDTLVEDYFKKHSFISPRIKGVFQKKHSCITPVYQNCFQFLQNLKNKIQKLTRLQKPDNKNLPT